MFFSNFMQRWLSVHAHCKQKRHPLTAPKSQPLVTIRNPFFVCEAEIPAPIQTHTHTHTHIYRNLSDPAVDPVTRQDLLPALAASQVLLLSPDPSKGTDRNRGLLYHREVFLGLLCFTVFSCYIHIYKVNVSVHSTMYCLEMLIII